MRLKDKVCAVCDEEFPPRQALQKVCSLDCALVQSRKKQAESAEKTQKKRDKVRKEKLKTKTEWAKQAQKEVNTYVRMRDYWLGCVSCGKSKEEIELDQSWKPGGAWDAGHYRGRGKASHLKYNLLNIQKQCKSCNGGNGKYQEFGNRRQTIEQAYRVELVNRIGEERVAALDNNNQIRKFDIEYLKRVKAIFSKRARYYEKRRGL